MMIQDYITYTGAVAKYAEIYSTYQFNNSLPQISITLFNEEYVYLYDIPLAVDESVILEWRIIAEKEPQKAGFLDFTIIAEWACKKSGIVPLDPTTFS
jgi:hypothetical protein